MQLLSDVTVIGWIVIWVMVGMAVHSAVSTIAEVGTQVEGGANGIAENLNCLMVRVEYLYVEKKILDLSSWAGQENN